MMNNKKAGAFITARRWVMAGMLMLSGVGDDCGKIHYKKAVLVGAVPLAERGPAGMKNGGPTYMETGVLRIRKWGAYVYQHPSVVGP